MLRKIDSKIPVRIDKPLRDPFQNFNGTVGIAAEQACVVQLQKQLQNDIIGDRTGNAHNQHPPKQR